MNKILFFIFISFHTKNEWMSFYWIFLLISINEIIHFIDT